MTRPGVGVGVLVYRDGKFLMMQRKGSHGAGTWSVPGGWMELGESFEEAAVREIDEETGMQIKNVKFIALTNNIMLDEGVHSITVWLRADWKAGEPVITEPEKCSDQQWIDFDTLPAELFHGFKMMLESDFLPEVKRQLEASKASNV